jgi:hypothetical protein
MERNSNTNRIPGLSVYLGGEPERSRRVTALKRLAERLHISMSEMFRLLADGELSLIVTPPDVVGLGERQQEWHGASSATEAEPESQDLPKLMNDPEFRANMATAFASEQVLAREWLTPEEDEAWRDL